MNNLTAIKKNLKSLVRTFRGFIGNPKFTWIGKGNEIIGNQKQINVGNNVIIRNFNWIEAVSCYQGDIFSPEIILSDDVAISNFTHISAVKKITIGKGCLLGSKIYIGDHSHGNPNDINEILMIPPRQRKISAIDEVYIGENCWIGDGTVILAGSYIHANSIIGANSVVKIKTDKPALIAGIPAKVVKYFI